jgi:hypothetical protein
MPRKDNRIRVLIWLILALLALACESVDFIRRRAKRRKL